MKDDHKHKQQHSDNTRDFLFRHTLHPRKTRFLVACEINDTKDLSKEIEKWNRHHLLFVQSALNIPLWPLQPKRRNRKKNSLHDARKTYWSTNIKWKFINSITNRMKNRKRSSKCGRRRRKRRQGSSEEYHSMCCAVIMTPLSWESGVIIICASYSSGKRRIEKPQN